MYVSSKSALEAGMLIKVQASSLNVQACSCKILLARCSFLIPLLAFPFLEPGLYKPDLRFFISLFSTFFPMVRQLEPNWV